MAACFVISVAFVAPREAAADSPDSWKLSLVTLDEEPPHRIVLSGLSADHLRQVRTWDASNQSWAQLLSVRVATKNGTRVPNLLGDYHLTSDQVEFWPRFSLRPGMTYKAVADPQAIQGPTSSPLPTISHRFTIRQASGPASRVLAVYPSGDVLPENLLKFYVHFSIPMRQGNVYRYCKLLNEATGQEVSLPFLEIEQELWSRSGKRLTLLFDPGRIKRGLKPREQEGPILEEGKSYRLVIERSWPDANGRPLANTFSKLFRVVAPDQVQPATRRWVVKPPQASTREPLTIAFDEPLDHAMLQRVLNVQDSDGQSIPGEIAVANHERRWVFIPQSPWSSGTYRISIDSALEDCSGNSLGRPFEIDVFDKVDAVAERPGREVIGFTVVE